MSQEEARLLTEADIRAILCPSGSDLLTDVLEECSTGDLIPPIGILQERLSRILVVHTTSIPRDHVVRGIAVLLRNWACELGVRKAARRLAILLSDEFLNVMNRRSRDERGVDSRSGSGDSEDYRSLLPSDNSNSSSSDVESGCSDGCPSSTESGFGGSAEGSRVVALPSSRGGLSRRLVELELSEHEKDLAAFVSAYDTIHRRVQEVKDEQRLLTLVNWSGTSAVMGALELTIHAIERTVNELREMKNGLLVGAIPNLDEG